MNDKLKHKIINYLNKEYSGLTIYETDKWKNYIFFIKNDKVIFYYNKKNGYVGISYDKIWSFLESFFELKYKEIQDLTKEWVEEQFKSEVTTTSFLNVILSDGVEEQFKSEVTTTNRKVIVESSMVEEHYKLSVTTTNKMEVNTEDWVEELYKLRATESSSVSIEVMEIVEEHNKLRVTTTDFQGDAFFYLVEGHNKLGTNER